ncbi:MAG: hypothetical protein ACKO9I_18350, partial [Sphaerospermopsis kisseleviana]
RYQSEFRMFELRGDRYIETLRSTPLDANSRFWIPGLELGLGIWQGGYKNVQMPWLRWYDQNGNWVLTPAEQEREKAEQERQRGNQERQRAEQERQKKEKLIAQLRALGVEPDID